ncbi:MAG: hypothetical protein ABIH88_02710 [Patescibacteria group bacterium]|nr:hypothetical protein [Patescibacteria group bacterium]
MKNIFKFLKSKIIFIILAALSTVVVFFWFSNKDSLPAEKELAILSPEKIVQENVSSIVDVSVLKTNFPNFTESVPVYQIGEFVFTQSKALKLAENLGFNQAPIMSQDIELGLTYSWSSSENSLTIRPTQGELLYGLDLLNFPNLIKGNLPNIQDVEQIVDSFIFSKIIAETETLSPQRESSFYIKRSGPQFIKADKTEAELIQVNYQFKIDGLQILREKLKDFPLTLIIGPENRIVRLEYFAPPSKIKVIDYYPLKGKDIVLEEITTRPKISFLEIDQKPMIVPSDLENIAVIKYEKVSLAYLHQTNSDQLLPIYLISGTAKLKNQENAKVYLYILAIEEKFIKEK